MPPIYILQWFHNDEWNEIGWRADSLKSYLDLKTHGQNLANDDQREQYRMVYALSGDVIHEFIKE